MAKSRSAKPASTSKPAAAQKNRKALAKPPAPPAPAASAKAAKAHEARATPAKAKRPAPVTAVARPSASAVANGNAASSSASSPADAHAKSLAARPAAPATDVLVLGSHPACYLAAALLAEEGVPVVHATIPGEPVPDRLVLINPKFFELHSSLAAVKRELDLAPIHGLRFLADNAGVESESVGKSVAGYVASYRDVLDRIIDIAAQRRVRMLRSERLELHHVDERGVDASINGERMRPKLLILGGALPDAQKKMLGLPEEWDAEVPHRYTYLKLPGTHWIGSPTRGNGNGNGGSSSAGAATDPNAAAHAAVEAQCKPVMAMSLDLKGILAWAWLKQGVHEIQLSVEQPSNSAQRTPPMDLLYHWANVLRAHGMLKEDLSAVDFSRAESVDLPFAGALAQEGVANRTLLIGPAGGFYTACGEDIYPNCWSAIFAADVAKKAVKERHLQDALRAYREKWGSTLGDYLRGPQQNLRFLLPLVYRNPVMTTRLSEAILTGASVVR